MTAIAVGSRRHGHQGHHPGHVHPGHGHQDRPHGHRRRGARHSFSRGAVRLALTVGVLGLVSAPVAFMLWPRWPEPVASDAPSLPIMIGDVTFNIPPAAIRFTMQRRPGTQARVDLSFLWPSLVPPEAVTKANVAAQPKLSERLFVTIAGSNGTLTPPERLKSIYPRYTDGNAGPGADGLVVRNFRAGTPYQGEELIYDPSAPERFLSRCTRNLGSTPGMCLHERRIGAADITVRFPRDWLADWRPVAGGIDRLIGSMRPHGG